MQSPRSCRQLGGEGAEGKESTRLRSLQQRWRIRQEEGGAEPDAQMLTKITTASLLDCRKTSLPPPPSFHALSRAGFFLFIPPTPRTSLALRKLAFMMDIPRARLRDGASQQPGGTGRREHRRDRAEPRRAERSRDTRGPAAQLPPTPAAHPAGESVSRYLSCRFSFCRPSSLFPPGTEPACHSPLAHTLPPWGC